MKFNLKIVAATAAVAMMSSGAAMAQALVEFVPAGPYIYSLEGLTLADDEALVLPDVQVTFGNNLTNNDDIFITLPGVTSLPFTPSNVNMVCSVAGNAVGYVTTVNGGWNFRVSAVAGFSIGDTCTFSGLEVEAGSLTDSNGDLVYEARRQAGGVLVDRDVNDTTFSIVSQFALTEDEKLNGVINVYDDRLSFVDAETEIPGAGNFEDTLNFTTTEDADGTTFEGPVVTTDGVAATINGDFEWVDSDGDGTCEAGEFDAAISYASWSADGDSTCNQLVWVGTPGDDTHTGFFEVPGDVILNPVDWLGTVTWSYSYGAAEGTKTQNWDPGIWGINGAQVYIQYMPYGTGIGRIIYAANTGSINADATADVYYDGSVTKCDLGGVGSKKVTMLSAAIDTCALTALGTATSGKVAILLTFTAPDKDIEVYSAYNVNGSDRGTVVNTSNGRTFFYGTGFPFVPPGP